MTNKNDLSAQLSQLIIKTIQSSGPGYLAWSADHMAVVIKVAERAYDIGCVDTADGHRLEEATQRWQEIKQ